MKKPISLKAILLASWRFVRWFGWRFTWIITLLLIIWFWQVLPDQLFNTPTSTVLEDHDGQLLGARIAKDGQWRFPARAEVPSRFATSLIQFEDRRFYHHIGISPKAFARATKQNFTAGRVVSGGSTLSMQVVRLMRQGKSRTIKEKLIEVVMAIRLELSYSKDEILALYASHAPFGGNVVGLDAASWRYFGRSPQQLSWAESATLAVLPNAPSLIYPGKNEERLRAKRNRLLDRLYAIGQLDSIGWELALAEPLPGKPHPLPQLTPHLLDRVQAEGHNGQRLVTTIDADLQRYVTRMVKVHHNRLQGSEIHNAAALVLSVRDGKVLAYVGNTPGGNGQHGNHVDVIRAPRSTGSILKPFLYAAMLDAGQITPERLIPDVPTNFGAYAPKNFTNNYDGAVPARKALARSLNIPAVRMLNQYGTERFHHQLKQWGLSTLHQPADHYGLSLVLGGAEANLWDLAGIYAQFGRTLHQYPAYEPNLMAPPTYLEKDQDHTIQGNLQLHPVVNAPLNPAAIYETLEAMVDVTRPDQERNWRAFASSHKIAWKTGTSFGYRDAWAIGLTSEYVVAVWVGNADGEGRPGIVGLHAAAPLMFDVFDRLPRSPWFHRPEDEMTPVLMCARSGYRASSICPTTDTALLPNPCLKTTACPFHQWVHLDSTESYQVDSECEPIGNMHHTAWFVLPPLMEWYYRYNDPLYKPLPPYRSDCQAAATGHSMALIYPKRGSKIYVPIELDGQRGRSVFEATHRKPSAKIFWHLDEEYIGATTDIHQLAFQPGPGSHRLKLVDEFGEQVVRDFEVMGK